MIHLRAILFNVGYFGFTAAMVIFGLPFLCRRRWAVWYSERWTDVLVAWLKVTVGLDHVIVGRENLPSEPYIIAAKHQSAFDTLVLNRLAHDPAIVLKRELTLIPIFGWYLVRPGHIVVDRKAGASAVRKLIAQARSVVAEGRSIAIFPEGTRGPVGGSLPYQPGVAALYSQLGIPLVPVALDSGLFWRRNSFGKQPGRIVIEILPPINPGLDRRYVLGELERRIETATAKLLAAQTGPIMPVDNLVDNKPVTGHSGESSGA
ncbi:MAG: lysophospholipid acyltransferase family protein [Aliidongia sp.]